MKFIANKCDANSIYSLAGHFYFGCIETEIISIKRWKWWSKHSILDIIHDPYLQFGIAVAVAVAVNIIVKLQ